MNLDPSVVIDLLLALEPPDHIHEVLALIPLPHLDPLGPLSVPLQMIVALAS